MDSKFQRMMVPAIVVALFAAGSARAVTDEEFNALKLKVSELEAKASTSEEAAANNNMVLSGNMSLLYSKQQGGDGGFTLGSVDPIFLYRVGNKLLFECELELEVSSDENGETATETTIEYAQLDYLLCDEAMLVAGKIVLPMGSFIETSDPAWINKLPTFPLPRADETAILPESDIGIELRGGINAGDGLFNYAAYVVNCPGHSTETTTDENGNEVTVETLTFDPVVNQNNSLGYGGRVGFFQPFVEGSDFEAGISGETGKWDSKGDLSWSAAVFDARLHLTPAIELRGEYMTTKEETLAGDVKPDGWWAQAAYKLSGLNSDISVLNKTELVARYAEVNADNGEGTTKQTAVGIDYHVAGTFVVKGDYEFNTSDNEDLAKDQLNLQLAVGF